LWNLCYSLDLSVVMKGFKLQIVDILDFDVGTCFLTEQNTLWISANLLQGH
jgi:hypothetical protein